MGTVYTFPRHHWHRCRTAEGAAECKMCLGGLAWCLTCNGGEAGIPTDCPGRRMTREEEWGVMEGRVDYRFPTGWVEGKSSTWDRRVKPYGRRIRCT